MPTMPKWWKVLLLIGAVVSALGLMFAPRHIFTGYSVITTFGLGGIAFIIFTMIRISGGQFEYPSWRIVATAITLACVVVAITPRDMVVPAMLGMITFQMGAAIVVSAVLIGIGVVGLLQRRTRRGFGKPD